MEPRRTVQRLVAALACLVVATACTPEPSADPTSPTPQSTASGETVGPTEATTSTAPTEPDATPEPIDATPEPTTEPAGSPTAVSSPQSCPTPPPADDVSFDQALHDELVDMLERDQASFGQDPEGRPARTERLREILAEHGWPGFDLVGEDGEDAAWAIAQHSDHDRDFQLCALELLRDAFEAGQGSPGNVAYLSDRVAVSGGEPQVYGTQLNCGPDGPTPQTPLVDEHRIDELRAEMDLPPWEDYLAEFDAICQPPE